MEGNEGYKGKDGVVFCDDTTIEGAEGDFGYTERVAGEEGDELCQDGDVVGFASKKLRRAVEALKSGVEGVLDTTVDAISHAKRAALLFTVGGVFTACGGLVQPSPYEFSDSLDESNKVPKVPEFVSPIPNLGESAEDFAKRSEEAYALHVKALKKYEKDLNDYEKGREFDRSRDRACRATVVERGDLSTNDFGCSCVSLTGSEGVENANLDRVELNAFERAIVVELKRFDYKLVDFSVDKSNSKIYALCSGGSSEFSIVSFDFFGEKASSGNVTCFNVKVKAIQEQKNKRDISLFAKMVPVETKSGFRLNGFEGVVSHDGVDVESDLKVLLDSNLKFSKVHKLDIDGVLDSNVLSALAKVFPNLEFLRATVQLSDIASLSEITHLREVNLKVISSRILKDAIVTHFQDSAIVFYDVRGNEILKGKGFVVKKQRFDVNDDDSIDAKEGALSAEGLSAMVEDLKRGYVRKLAKKLFSIEGVGGSKAYDSLVERFKVLRGQIEGERKYEMRNGTPAYVGMEVSTLTLDHFKGDLVVFKAAIDEVKAKLVILDRDVEEFKNALAQKSERPKKPKKRKLRRVNRSKPKAPEKEAPASQAVNQVPAKEAPASQAVNQAPAKDEDLPPVIHEIPVEVESGDDDSF